MNYGALLGTLLVFFGFLFHFMNILDFERPFLVISINTILMYFVLFFSIKSFRDLYNDGFINYSKCVKIGITVSVFSAFIFGLWKMLLINYINVEYVELSIQKQQQLILEMDEKIPTMFDDVDSVLDEIEMQSSDSNSPFRLIFNEIMSKAFGGFLLSSIIYFFVKKEDPNLIS